MLIFGNSNIAHYVWVVNINNELQTGKDNKTFPALNNF